MKLSLKLKLKVTGRAVTTLLMRPAYAVFALASGMGMLGVLVWSQNYSLLRYVVSNTTLSIPDKLTFIFDGYKNLFTNFSLATSVGMLLFCVALGINLSCILFTIQKQAASRVSVKANGSAVAMAVVSSSCIACGTSFVAPLVAALGGTASPFIERATALTIWIGLLLLLYSIMRMSPIIVSPAKTHIAPK